MVRAMQLLLPGNSGAKLRSDFIKLVRRTDYQGCGLRERAGAGVSCTMIIANNDRVSPNFAVGAANSRPRMVG